MSDISEEAPPSSGGESDDSGGTQGSFVATSLEWIEAWNVAEGSFDEEAGERLAAALRLGLGSFVDEDEGESRAERWRRWQPALSSLAQLISTLTDIGRALGRAAEAEGDVVSDEALEALSRDLDRVRDAWPNWIDIYFDLDHLDGAIRRAARRPESRRAAREVLDVLFEAGDACLEHGIDLAFEESESEPLSAETLEYGLATLDGVLDEWIDRWFDPHVLNEDAPPPRETTPPEVP